MKMNELKKRKLKEYAFVYSAIIVQLTVFAVFYVYCNFKSILMAFQLRDAAGKVFWTFDNFTRIFKDFTSTNSGELWLATGNTFKFFLLSQILFPIAFLNSYFLFLNI